MPRSVEEILAHADELAARFEAYDPAEGDELDTAAIAGLRAAAQARSAAEGQLVSAIRDARAAGMSWAAIGTFVGTTGEAVRQRYGTIAVAT